MPLDFEPNNTNATAGFGGLLSFPGMGGASIAFFSGGVQSIDGATFNGITATPNDSDPIDIFRFDLAPTLTSVSVDITTTGFTSFGVFNMGGVSGVTDRVEISPSGDFIGGSLVLESRLGFDAYGEEFAALSVSSTNLSQMIFARANETADQGFIPTDLLVDIARFNAVIEFVSQLFELDGENTDTFFLAQQIRTFIETPAVGGEFETEILELANLYLEFVNQFSRARHFVDSGTGLEEVSNFSFMDSQLILGRSNELDHGFVNIEGHTAAFYIEPSGDGTSERYELSNFNYFVSIGVRSGIIPDEDMEDPAGNGDAPSLTLAIDPSILSEFGEAIGTITRSTDTTEALVVTLASDDVSEATVPATVTIAAGDTSATFTVSGVNDAIIDGDQFPTITASADGFEDGTANVTVTDVDVPILMLEINPTTLSEDGEATGTVTRNTDTAEALTVTLASNDISEASVPAMVTIAAGETSATFTVSGVNDAIIDGDQTPTITAFALGFPVVSASVTVNDVASSVFNGDDNNNIITGLFGNDTINGLGGDDTLIGGAGADIINGGDGNDNIIGGLGADTIDGGTGNFDTAFYDQSFEGVTVNLDGAAGSGGEAEGDTLTGIEQVVGSLFDDVITGNDANNIFFGLAGADALNGGDGSDTASFVGSGAGVIVNLIIGEGAGGDAEGDTFTSIENLTGSAFDDIFVASDDATANDFVGGAGADTFLGLGGNDTLNGGAGNDLLLAGLGDDVVFGEAGDDVIEGSDGNDTLDGGADNDLIFGQGGDDLILGQAGADILLGGADGDTIDGGSGNDTILGGAGDNNLTGGEGDDLILGGNEIDTIIGNGGNDVIEANGGNDTLLAGEGNNIVLAGEGNDLITAGTGTDALLGGGGNDTIEGGAGADTLIGGLGNDVLIGGDGADQIISQFGANSLSGGAGEDFLEGAELGDILNGGADNDFLNGLAGNDTLNGSGGSDTLIGGLGADTFVFDNEIDSENVLDFEDNVDQLDLTAFGFGDVTAALGAAVETVGGAVFFDFGDGNTALINNITEAQLSDDILV